MDPIIETRPDGSIDVTYFLYTPSKSAGWAFAAWFAITTLAHFILMFPFRSALFIPLVIGGISNADHRGAADDSATVYMSLSRMVTSLHARENALMSPRAMTPLFVTADIIAFISQVAGVGLQASTSEDTQATGQKIVLGGLIIQLLLLALFIINIFVFHRKNERNPTALTDHPQLPRWRRLVYTLYFIGTAILIRNLVRAVGYGQGPRGMIARNDVFLYVFAAALMFGSMAALLVSHPGRMIKKAKRADAAIANATAESVKEGLGVPRTIEP